MRKLILVVHTSLDGFVADIKGELDKFPIGDDNLGFVYSLTEEADAALFGRISFELLNNYWPDRKDDPIATENEIKFSTWYKSAEKIIFSRTLNEEDLINSRIINKNIAEEIIEIKNKSGKDILIFGSPTIARILMNLDLIDNYWIFINPIIFGQGIPLFSDKINSRKLKLLRTRLLLNGELALNYLVEKEPL